MQSSDDATRKLRSGSREPVLRVAGLSTYFAVRQGLLRRTVGHVRAVDGVDLRVLRGQTLVVAGEAGAGKTTLARSITRAVPTRRGKVLLEGRDLLGLSKSDFRALGRQVQSVSAEMLAVPDPLGVLRALTEAEPKLLIFDEAFAGLDDAVRVGLFEELRRSQNERGLSCLLLTREPKLSSALADEVAVMHAGQIVETGATASVLGNARHPYTQALLLAKPGASPGQALPAAGAAESLSGCRYRGRCPHAFARCAQEEPVLFVVPGGLSRCFLNDPSQVDA